MVVRRKNFRKNKKRVVQKVKEDLNTRAGTVIESLPNTLFRIEYDDDKNNNEEGESLPIVGLNGKMKKFRIKVLIGDKVEVLQDEYGGRGRIIKRLRN